MHSPNCTPINIKSHSNGNHADICVTVGACDSAGCQYTGQGSLLPYSLRPARKAEFLLVFQQMLLCELHAERGEITDQYVKDSARNMLHNRIL